MAVLYVKEQGSFVQKRGERIVVSKGNLTLLESPVVNIENVAIIGNVQITTQALHMLMENGIDAECKTWTRVCACGLHNTGRKGIVIIRNYGNMRIFINCLIPIIK